MVCLPIMSKVYFTKVTIREVVKYILNNSDVIYGLSLSQTTTNKGQSVNDVTCIFYEVSDVSWCKKWDKYLWRHLWTNQKLNSSKVCLLIASQVLNDGRNNKNCFTLFLTNL